jgi:hypothetical protein
MYWFVLGLFLVNATSLVLKGIAFLLAYNPQMGAIAIAIILFLATSIPLIWQLTRKLKIL